MDKKQLMYDRINKHGEDLKRIFKLDPSIDPVKLCKQLFRLENKAHRLAEDGCNGVIYDTEPQAEKILKKVYKILNIDKSVDHQYEKIFFNGDPRGYALKLSTQYTRYIRSCNINIHQDWGGYGIIAPDFREGL
jgi:hypothetical protein